MAGYQCISTLLCLLAVTASAQELVTCYQRDRCSSSGGVFEGVTMQACCDNINGGESLDGLGLGTSFQQDGVEGCTPCPVVLGFIPSVFFGIERGVTFSVQAGFLSGRPPQGGNLNLNLVLRTAGARDVSISPRVQPRATEPIRTFQITLTVDGISQELNETFSIEFTGFDLGDIFLFPDEAPVTINTLPGTIIDQDGVEFSLSEDDFRENEAPNAMMAIQIAKDGILANPVIFRVTPMTVFEAERLGIVNFTRPADDDISPSRADTNDFNATAFNVIFPADEIVNIPDVLRLIRIVDDEIDEAQEQDFIIFLEVLDAVNFDLITVTRDTSFGRIIDNDAIQIGFALPQYSFNEPDFETIVNDIVLVREGGRLSEQTFQVTISVGSTINIPLATLEFENEEIRDYSLTSPMNFIMLNFPPDRQNITLAVILFGDDLPEPTEAFRATSTPSPNFPNFGPPSMGGAFASTDVLIFDDDFRVVVGFVQPNYTFSENVSTGDVCVQVFIPTPDEDLPFDIDLMIQPRIGTADVSDFLNRTIPAVSISASNATGLPRETCAFIRITDDVFYEEDVESFHLELLLDPLGLQSGVTVDPNITTVFIVDDDGVVIDFIGAPYEVNEADGDARVTVGVVSGQLMRDVVVELAFSDAMAISGFDYTAVGPFTLTFNSTSPQFFDIPLIDDFVVENTENLNAMLSFPGGIAPPRVSIAEETTQIIILDDDSITVALEETFFLVNEEDGAFIQVCVNITEGELARDASVTLQTTDGTATSVGDIDFNSLDTEITFSADLTRMCFNISVLNDNIHEVPENFFIGLDTEDTSVNIDPTRQNGEAVILDDDVPVVGFERTLYRVSENDSLVMEICAILMPPPSLAEGVNFTVTITFVDGTAQAPEDFNEQMTSLTFDSTTSRSCVDFTALDDDVVEESENLTAMLTSNDDVTLSPDEATIVIVDDGVILVMFERPSYTFNEEDGMGIIEIVKSGTASEPFDIQVVGGPSTQTDVEVSAAGIDTVVTFGAGGSAPNSIPIPFAIMNDEVGLEAIEKYTVTLEILTLMNLVQPGMPAETEVNILDNDPVVVSFGRPNVTVDETDGEFMMCVVKDRDTAVNVTVTIDTKPGTAMEGSDYDADRVPTTVTIPGDASRMCFTSDSVIDDNEDEDDETFVLEIVEVDPDDPRVNVTDGTTTVIIVDNDELIVTNETFVNDTIIGDPLFTVPILVPAEQLTALNFTRISLCYEIHGQPDQWFNLVTDECATVNAQYFSLSRRLNFIDEIGVRAMDDNNRCVNIRVNVGGCTAEVNGVSLDLMERFSQNGISVRRYNNRVRISVPNCNELTLVMWAICEMRTVDNPDVPGERLASRMIKYVVMRGLNFGHRVAHGLLGQFWNIPVEVTPYNGQLRNGGQVEGRFIVNMSSLAVPRVYTGLLDHRTWESDDGVPCLHVGNIQAGPIYEVTNPNDGVIENSYSDYKVESAFSEENYAFGLFSEDRCVVEDATLAGPV